MFRRFATLAALALAHCSQSSGYVPSFDRAADSGKVLTVTSNGLSFGTLPPLTTKGDLVTWSTVPARLPVGTSGNLLVADPGQTTGIKWGYDHAGTATNDTACAGCVGEVLRLTRVRSAAIGLTTNTSCNIGSATCPSTGGTQSFTLTPGDWSCQAMAGFNYSSGGTCIQAARLSISKTSATLSASDTYGVPTSGEAAYEQISVSNMFCSGEMVRDIPPFQVTVSSNTPLYLVLQATFSVSTLTGWGSMECRRMR